MLTFDPTCLFPLLKTDPATYAAAQAHSAAVDDYLGLRTGQTEACISAVFGQQNWHGLGADRLLTPYTELRFMLSQLELLPGQTVVDLGAAYGRLGFVMHVHYPANNFLGYEISAERVRQGAAAMARFGADRARLLEADLSIADFVPEAAAIYFIYDYGTRSAIEKTLQDLRQIARRQAITVLGRGRSVRDAIENGHPWLAQVLPARHFAHHSIYRS